MEAVIVCIGSDGARAIAEILDYEIVEVVEAEDVRTAWEAELKAVDMIMYEELWERIEEEEKEEYPPQYIKKLTSQVIDRKPKYIRARTTC